MAEYLVAGAAGFIAFRVCQLLLQAGHAIVGVDNFSPDYDVRIKKWRLDLKEGVQRTDDWYMAEREWASRVTIG